MPRFFKEPLILFVLLGALLFVAYLPFKPEPVRKEVIRVRPEIIEALVQQEEMLSGIPMTAEGRKRILEGYIDDEILIREARRAGLDETDGRVRKRLLGVMRYSITDLVPDPSRQQLEAYYNENRERFRSDPTISFEQVSFRWDSDKLPGDPEVFRGQLAASENPAELGDASPMTNFIRQRSRAELVRGFGAAFADAVENLPVASEEWQGPFESHQGTHYLRVLERKPSSTPTLDEIEPFLRQDYLLFKTLEAQQKQIDAMRENYEIVMDSSPEA